MADDPDLVVTADVPTLAALVQGRTAVAEAEKAGRLSVRGSRAARRLLLATFDLR